MTATYIRGGQPDLQVRKDESDQGGCYAVQFVRKSFAFLAQLLDHSRQVSHLVPPRANIIHSPPRLERQRK